MTQERLQRSMSDVALLEAAVEELLAELQIIVDALAELERKARRK